MNKVGSFCLLLFVILPTLAIADDTKAEVGKRVGDNLNASSMILSLLMVLAIIVVSAMLLKKLNFHQGHSSELKIITSLHLSAKEKVVVIQVADKQLLLGVTNQQINLLQTLDEPLNIKPLANQQLAATIGKLLKKQS